MPIEKVHPDTVLEIESEIEGRIVVHGERATVRIGKGVNMPGILWIQGTGATVEIADGCYINGMIHIVRGEGSLVRIGPRTSFNAVGLSMHEAGQIIIGEDCMFSTDIHLDVSDMHPIYDRATAERLNPPRDIHVGDHVWVGTRVFLTKGVTIGEGAVIGGGAMVFGEIPAHSLAVGSPAKVVRTNITWRRDFDEVVIPIPPEPEPAPPPPRKPQPWLDRLLRLGQKPGS